MLYTCVCEHVCVLSCVWLWPHRLCSPLSSSVHGIFQARILEWVVTSYSRGSSWPRDSICILAPPASAGGFFVTVSPGKPHIIYVFFIIHITIIYIRHWYVSGTCSLLWLSFSFPLRVLFFSLLKICFP